MKFEAGDLVRLERKSMRHLIGLITRVRPCEFSGTEFNARICRVSWLASGQSCEYMEDQLVKA